MEENFEADPELTQAVKNAMGNCSETAAVKLRKYLESASEIRLKIAITGGSGKGKSSFVNAFRSIGVNDDHAAPTGVRETTMEVKEYPYPNHPNVILSDLPGIGTTKFPTSKYFKRVGFEKFDLFIIISANRFTENDIKLAKEIKKMGKKFYFVRSKVDFDLQNEKRKKDFSEQKTLAKIREDCVKSLKKLGIESQQVFLVSSHDIHLYDFSLLHETLEKDLPDHRKDALLLSSPSIFPDIIEEKKKDFQRQKMYLSAVSGFAAVVPLPGLSFRVNWALLVGAVTKYVLGFGLDIPSLKRTAARTGISYDELKAVLQSQLAAQEITKELIKKVILQLSNGATSIVALEVFSFVPIFGIPLSAATTNNLLKLFLDMLAEDAYRISERVLKV